MQGFEKRVRVEDGLRAWRYHYSSCLSGCQFFLAVDALTESLSSDCLRGIFILVVNVGSLVIDHRCRWGDELVDHSLALAVIDTSCCKLPTAFLLSLVLSTIYFLIHH